MVNMNIMKASDKVSRILKRNLSALQRMIKLNMPALKYGCC